MTKKTVIHACKVPSSADQVHMSYRSCSCHDDFRLLVLSSFLYPELQHEMCLVDLPQMLRIGLATCKYMQDI